MLRINRLNGFSQQKPKRRRKIVYSLTGSTLNYIDLRYDSVNDLYFLDEEALTDAVSYVTKFSGKSGGALWSRKFSHTAYDVRPIALAISPDDAYVYVALSDSVSSNSEIYKLNASDGTTAASTTVNFTVKDIEVTSGAVYVYGATGVNPLLVSLTTALANNWGYRTNTGSSYVARRCRVDPVTGYIWTSNWNTSSVDVRCFNTSGTELKSFVFPFGALTQETQNFDVYNNRVGVVGNYDSFNIVAAVIDCSGTPTVAGQRVWSGSYRSAHVIARTDGSFIFYGVDLTVDINYDIEFIYLGKNGTIEFWRKYDCYPTFNGGDDQSHAFTAKENGMIAWQMRTTGNDRGLYEANFFDLFTPSNFPDAIDQATPDTHSSGAQSLSTPAAVAMTTSYTVTLGAITSTNASNSLTPTVTYF